MRKDVVVEVGAADRARLEAIVADRNSPQKHVSLARIILLTAAALGTLEITRRTAAGALHKTQGAWQMLFQLPKGRDAIGT
jgi:hypothetical protein